MKIEVTKPDKEFYDELLYVVSYYKKKFKKKPNQKAKLISRFAMESLIKMCIFFTLAIILLMFALKEYDGYLLAFFIFTATFVGLNTVLFIFFNINVKKRIKEYVTNLTKTSFEINEKGIYVNREKQQSVNIEWDYIDRIIISKYSIAFIPKSLTLIAAGVTTTYKKEVLEAIKEYGKMDLVIDNTDLYKVKKETK